MTRPHASQRARLALVAVATGIGIAACSPSGASTNTATAPTPTTATTTPMNMNMSSPPSTGQPAAAVTVPAGAQAKVSITNFAFDPAVLSVKVGTKVVWTNNDIVAHTVTFTDVANSPVLNRGVTFSRTFTAPGTYSYICSIHPFMHGAVVVTA